MQLREFKPEQKEAIRLTLCSEDAFRTLPTGFSESAIYVYQLLLDCASAFASVGKLPDLN